MGIHKLKKFAAVGALACLLAALGAASASAAPMSAAAPAGLSVTITDGLEKVSSDTAASYTAELRNTGSEVVSARLVVTVPAYAEVTAAEGGEIVGADASWLVSVEPGETTTVVAAAHIGEIPEGELRVTTLVSVYLGDEGPAPAIRSADANLIEGVTDPSTVVAETERLSEGVQTWLLPIAIAGGVLLVAVFAIVGVVVMRAPARARSRGARRRRARARR